WPRGQRRKICPWLPRARAPYGKRMSESKIAEVVESLLKGVQGISKSETIIGAAQQAGDATVIPVHRLKIAFGAASANAGARGAKVGGDSGGHGAGGAVELEPVAAI